MTLTPIQEQWLQALESGNYKQGKRKLRSIGDEYCCLGVACDLLQSPVFEGKDCYVYCGSMGEMTEYKKLGLRDKVGSFVKCFKMPTGRHCFSLAGCNDFGMSFVEIAAYIRANPENVFVERTT